jgi:hypothetical protein
MILADQSNCRGIKVPSSPEWLHEIKYEGYRLRVAGNLDAAGGNAKLKHLKHAPEPRVMRDCQSVSAETRALAGTCESQ